MADIEEALYSRLTSVTAVSTIVASRVYPNVIDDSTTATPYIVLTREGGFHNKVHDGPTGIAEASLDILCVTSGTSAYKNVKALRNAVRIAIDGRSGTWGGVKVRLCFIEPDADTPTFAIDANQQKRCGVSLLARCLYFEGTT